MIGKNRFFKEITNAVFVLLLISFLSVSIGLFLNAESLGNWGSWLGAFIAGIALVASSYAIVIQARQGESASWNIALGRLGELYDMAQNESNLAIIITEPTDPDGKVFSSPIETKPTPKEIVWLGSLFLAYEQIYVATLALSSESQRVWRLYLKNQLNKPFIRSAFVRDAMDAKDFHNDFWQFVRGFKSLHNPSGYSNYAIHPKFFDSLHQGAPLKANSSKLRFEAFSQDHSNFWMELYNDTTVRRQMYAAPLDSSDSLREYLSVRHVFTAFLDNEAVGGFTISKDKDLIGTFGIVLKDKFRNKGLANQIMAELENRAKVMGLLTLRADVYTDNFPCIRTLEKSGFRRFIWFEKNLSECS